MAAIHAGEVEGKEAALMLVRTCSTPSWRAWIAITLLVAPAVQTPTENGPHRPNNRKLGDRTFPRPDCPRRVGTRARMPRQSI